jgi:hypothetical protein
MGFEPEIPPSERLQTNALDHASLGLTIYIFLFVFCVLPAVNYTGNDVQWENEPEISSVKKHENRLHLLSLIWWLAFWGNVAMDKIHTTKRAENRRAVWQMDRNNREFKRESLQVFVAVLSSVSFVP